ncbi:MAG: M15 family metallopeptidase [Bacillota bacterium]|nr:M15 family metallopeptidase [Bacillota bacterium]
MKLKEYSKEVNTISEDNCFVLLKEIHKCFIIELRYATDNNFTGQRLYQTDICVLRKATAEKLAEANEEFRKLGYRVKIWDAYRPPYVQKIFWDMVKDKRFIANPDEGGSIHSRGCAVDITLVDKNGQELEMPSGFDDFSKNAFRDNPNMSEEARKNVELLTSIMIKHGFTTINEEWWHFEDVDAVKYFVVDIDVSLFRK